MNEHQWIRIKPMLSRADVRGRAYQASRPDAREPSPGAVHAVRSPEAQGCAERYITN